MTIFIGSTNPVKINAVTNAASETWPEIKTIGLDTESAVSEQPWGDKETKIGAKNRALHALELGKQQMKHNDEYLGIGLEGGVIEIDEELWSTVWVAVVDGKKYWTFANGARFKIPEIIATRIQNGEEMGPIVAELMKDEKIRQKQGMIGVITNGFVDRTEEYTGICKMALGLWYGKDWEEKLNK